MKNIVFSGLSLAKPDLLADSEPGGCLRSPGFTKLKIQSEDPHRKMYKRVLSIVFLILTGANLVLDTAFQVNHFYCHNILAQISYGKLKNPKT